jgi:hypothetical protein
VIASVGQTLLQAVTPPASIRSAQSVHFVMKGLALSYSKRGTSNGQASMQ